MRWQDSATIAVAYGCIALLWLFFGAIALGPTPTRKATFIVFLWWAWPVAWFVWFVVYPAMWLWSLTLELWQDVRS